MTPLSDAITVRPARSGDGPDVLALWRALLDDQAALEPRFGRSDDAAERWRNDYPEWLQDAARRVIVAEHEGDLVGFITAQRWTPAPVYRFSDEIYIDELYVHPAWRGRGVGRRLVEAIRAWGEDLGAARLRVGVLAANEAGRAFWEALEAQPFSLTLTIDLPSSAPRRPPRKRRPLGFR